MHLQRGSGKYSVLLSASNVFDADCTPPVEYQFTSAHGATVNEIHYTTASGATVPVTQEINPLRKITIMHCAFADEYTSYTLMITSPPFVDGESAATKDLAFLTQILEETNPPAQSA